MTGRGRGAGLLVAALSTGFGVALLQLAGVLGAVTRQETGNGGAAAAMLQVLAFVFVGLSVYCGAIVTTNTVATVVAGRTRMIALRRLLGGTARAERAAIAREQLGIGALGALLGLVGGSALAIVGYRIAVGTGTLPESGYSFTDPTVLLPVVAVPLAGWAAAWAGSRRVLTVRPVQAVHDVGEPTDDEAGGRLRTVLATVAVVGGTLLLVLGILIGFLTPAGVIVAFLGGVVSFTGIVLAAHRVLPPALALVGRLAGRTPSARIAAANALRYPVRSTRATVGLVIGVTLITTFAVAITSFGAALHHLLPGGSGLDVLLNGITTVFSLLTALSAVVAAVGLVSTLSLSVLQRTRELGLLRALGFGRRAMRAMVVVEGAQLVVTATLLGLVLGVVYGWAGAQSLLGSMQKGLVAPALPWPIVGAIVLGAVVLTLVASLAPAARAARVAPVAALAIE